MEEETFDLPKYFIFGARPVKIVIAEERGKIGVDVLAYNWDTGEFERAPAGYLERALTGFNEYGETESDDKRVTEEEFEQYVKELRAELEKK